MKKGLFTLAILFIVCDLSFSKPVFTSSKYLIACLYDNANGAVIPNAGEYSLIYNPTLNGDVASDSAYWIIKEETEGCYSFQNAASGKFIKHISSATLKDRWSLELVDSIQADNSTYFTLELAQQGNLSYFIVRSVVNPVKVWERRSGLQVDSKTNAQVYPFAVFDENGGNLQKFIFYNTEGSPVVDVVPLALPKAAPTLGVFSTFMDSLKFAGKVPVVDKTNGGFYLSVPEGSMGSDVTMNVTYKPKVATYSLYIDGVKVNSGSNYTFSQVTGTTTYSIEIREGASSITSGTIIFSCLPFIQIYSDATISSVYELGRIVVTEPENFTPSEVLLSEFKTRGYFAANQIKKSYAIKLKDTDGITATHRSFFNLRDDNNWILDAMYNDPARMKNRLSTDFWLDFSTPPYYASQEPNMVNGTRGHFVEVFLNDSYNGLYCMTEKIDRQQLNVKKLVAATATTEIVQRGYVVKADDWSDATWFGLLDKGSLYAPTNNAESWYRFDVKYPEVSEGEPFNWKTLSDAVNVVTYSSSASNFETKVADYYDMPVFLDYYLFMDLLLLTDNHGKNFFISVYDQNVSTKMSLTPWDLDSSWGRYWDGSAGDRMKPDQSFESFISSYVPRQSTLYKRLMSTNVWGFNDKLKSRYQELRGTYFDHNSIMERFYKYNALFQKSGADEREMSRWDFNAMPFYTDMSSELDYISTWINARLAWLDKQYLGGPYVKVDVPDVTTPQISVSPNPVQNMLTVSNIHSGDLVQVISIQGQVIAQVLSSGDNVEVDMSRFASGVYVVKVGGTVIKVVKKKDSRFP